MTAALKYPRTPHVEGSREQPGDEGAGVVPLDALRGKHVVIEEKLDGANAAVRFGDDGTLLLQSRGHVLDGGPRERHFDLLKRWASAHRDALFAVLGARYVMYGEWLHARHTVFYDALPHYFVEFDVLDREAGVFLSTPRRRALLAALPVTSAPVLHEGAVPAEPARLVGTSAWKTPRWRERLREACEGRVRDVARAIAEGDPSDAMEGLYLKVEAGGAVTMRAKYVRATFLQAVDQSGSHWLSRPIVPNRLRDGVDLFAPRSAP